MTVQKTPRRARSFAVTIALALLVSVLTSATAFASSSDDAVVVANRGSGDISVINTNTLSVDTVDLPGDAEPMYVSHDRKNGQVLVGDRASSTVVALDDQTYQVLGSVGVGDGVFHQWFDKSSRQLWVVGDTSQTVTVVDTNGLAVLATIDIPADVVEQGGKPHDVFVSKKHAFVSILGFGDGTGVVLQYSTKTFAETGRVTTGGDPHLFVSGSDLYVASQEGSLVSRYKAKTLEPLGSLAVPAAHGIFVTDKKQVLVTNIAGGGVDAIWELDKKLESVESVTNTLFPTPHNLTVDRDGQVWVTHSGATADQVSVIDLDNSGFGSSSAITVGTNPFGLAFVRG